MSNRSIGSNQSRGYGFVEMQPESEAKAAIAAPSRIILRFKAINLIQALLLLGKRDNASRGGRSSRFDDRVR